MRLAIVILNWQKAEATIRCATTLIDSFTDRLHIYIVDNNSCDGSIEQFCKWLPKCRIVSNVENSGYTGGNNLGLRAAFLDGNDAVLLLNNDVEPRLSKDFISLVANIVTTNPNTLIGLSVHNILGRQVFPHKAGLFMRTLFRACAVDTMTPLICGCAMVVPRAAFERIGELYEQYFMYCEELDYSVRMAISGGCVICPKELGYVVRDDEEVRRPYVFYYQARNLIHLIMLHAQNKKILLVILSAIITIKQSLMSGRFINFLMTLRGIIAALQGHTRRNPAAHT
jgi:GT2 family glycosyltransferase